MLTHLFHAIPSASQRRLASFGCLHYRNWSSMRFGARQETSMAGKLKTFGTASMVAAALLVFVVPSANAQMAKKGSHAAPSGDEKPRVDEKAYNAALKRIPDPKKPYDPWGQ